MKNIKKIVLVVIVLTMVFTMGAWTRGVNDALVEKELKSFGFVRDYYDDNLWTVDVVDYDTSDFDYVIIHGVYNMEDNFCVMTTVGVDTFRNLTVVLGHYVGEFDCVELEFTAIFEWENEDY